jgi:hypothetical protein
MRQDLNGNIKRQWNFNTLQINDFIFTPDAKSIIAGTTSLKRVTVENKLKQSISALVSSDGEGLPRDFGYGEMEHHLITIRLEDKEIIGYVLQPFGVGHELIIAGLLIFTLPYPACPCHGIRNASWFPVDRYVLR